VATALQAGGYASNAWGAHAFCTDTGCVVGVIARLITSFITYFPRSCVLLAAPTASVSPCSDMRHNSEIRFNIQPGLFCQSLFLGY